MEPMIDTCQAVLEREAKLGRNALDEQATAIFHIYRFLCDYENGGLSGFLYNISSEWDDLTSLGAIAARLDHPKLAAAISEAESVARSGPDDFQGTWGGWLEATDPAKRLEEIDGTISEHYQDLWDDLERLTASPA
jgi:hypothetical protein